MKNVIAALIIGIGLIVSAVVIQGPCLACQAGEIENQFVSGSLSPTNFEDKYETGDYVVLDVRTPEEYAEGKVFADAKLVDFYAADFKAQLSKLDKDQPYLIYCRSGNRTGETLKIMRELGFAEVYDLKGGKNAWESSGRELVR